VPAALGDMRLSLAVGGGRTAVGAQHAAPLRFADVVRRLEEMGYARVSTVTEVAQFSVRGGILDVYGFGMAVPARVEWWGDDVAPRDALFVEPAAWRARLTSFPRLALNAPDGDLRLPLAPPEVVDRDIRRLRQIVAGEPPTVILCDNGGQLERLEELLDTERATLV